jgi:hypothetical protein
LGNPQKGEVDLKAGEKTYRFRLSMNTLCEMEDHFGKTFNEIMADLGEKPSMKGLRTVVMFGLRDNEPAPNEKEAGQVIDEVGVTAINEALKKAIKTAFPDVQESAGENPQKASPKNGTGKAS